jgi:hypothetical protein
MKKKKKKKSDVIENRTCDLYRVPQLFTQHFIKLITLTEDMHVLLLLDLHQWHFSLAKENREVLVSFLPHSTNHIQLFCKHIYETHGKFVNSLFGALSLSL